MMKKLKAICSLIILFSLISIQISLGQIKVTMLDKKDVPSSIKYVGHIVNAAKYTDNDGDHLVITTETGKTPSKDKDFDGKDAALYAYHYKVTGDSYKQTWQVYDFIKDCGFDIFVGFIRNTFAITDLNKDGHAEVWLMYNVVCKSDVSPSPMKIIMHEDEKKYAIRGENRVDEGTSTEGGKHTFLGGKYVCDDAFKTAPPVFRNYAADLWNKNISETKKTQAF